MEGGGKTGVVAVAVLDGGSGGVAVSVGVGAMVVMAVGVRVAVGWAGVPLEFARKNTIVNPRSKSANNHPDNEKVDRFSLVLRISPTYRVFPMI